MDWQTIETAPKDGTNVILFLPGMRRQVTIGHYDIQETFIHGKMNRRIEGWWIDNGSGWTYKPSHWMSIPEPPK
jgi:hypothetical protein